MPKKPLLPRMRPPPFGTWPSPGAGTGRNGSRSFSPAVFGRCEETRRGANALGCCVKPNGETGEWGRCATEPGEPDEPEAGEEKYVFVGDGSRSSSASTGCSVS